LESKSTHKVKDNELEPADEFVDNVDMVGEYGDILYPDDGYEPYDYEDDGYCGYDGF
jgi:hypothetical protein